MMKLRWEAWKAGEQRGAFIVFTALAMWFLMMFVAFSVDFGNYYQHRSRLQNAADAAALAGVAEYTTEEIAKNTGAVNAPTLGKGRLIALVEGGNDASDGVKRRAREYVQNNYGEIEIKDNKVWSEEVTEEKTENGVKRNTTTTHRYCRVDLEDTVQTFFARIFGIESLPVKVSALAMMDGSADNETWGRRFAGIAERMEMLAPNQIWESLVNNSNTKAFSIIDPNPDKSSTGNVGFGDKQNRYYVTTGVASALLGQEKARIKHDYGNGIVIGYTDPQPGDKDYGICAKEIHLAPSISWEWLVARDDEMRVTNSNPSNPEKPLTTSDKNYRRCCPTTKIFNIADNTGVTKNNGKEIVALYLNRDHITNDDAATRSGLTDRFTEINVDRITTIAKITGDNIKNYVLPLYARLESEPIRIGTGRAIMPVHGVTVNVNAEKIRLGMHEEDGEIKFDGKVRPFVLAYDGPDPNRGKKMTNKDDPFDAPWIAWRWEDEQTRKEIDLSDVLSESVTDYAPAEIRQYIEPVVRKSYKSPYKATSYTEKEAERRKVLTDRGLVESALATSGPIYVNIPSGHVLYGAIYAPHSKVILDVGATGYIYGFILARKIEFAPGSKSYYSYKDSASLPVLAATIRDREKSIFDYERKYVTETYEIVFDYYEDFTDAKYYSSVIGTN